MRDGFLIRNDEVKKQQILQETEGFFNRTVFRFIALYDFINRKKSN